jgi:hypothetical protein
VGVFVRERVGVCVCMCLCVCVRERACECVHVYAAICVGGECARACVCVWLCECMGVWVRGWMDGLVSFCVRVDGWVNG